MQQNAIVVEPVKLPQCKKGTHRMYIYKVCVYGKKSFLSKESDTLRSYRVYISPTM